MSHTYSKFYDKAKEALDEMQKEFIDNPDEDYLVELRQIAWLFTNAAKWADGVRIDREKFVPKSGQIEDFMEALKKIADNDDE